MSHRIGTSRIVGATSLILFTAACCPAQESLLSNGDFAHWQDGAPQGWTVEVGARNGAESPVSEVKPMVGPALMMRGDQATMAWRSVSQDVAVTAGDRYRLVFEARSKDVRRQGRQYDNCYLGVMSFDARGKRVDMEIEDLSAARTWREFELKFAPPANSAKTDVLIFLSKSGTLNLRNLRLEEAISDRPFR